MTDETQRLVDVNPSLQVSKLGAVFAVLARHKSDEPVYVEELIDMIAHSCAKIVLDEIQAALARRIEKL